MNRALSRTWIRRLFLNDRRRPTPPLRLEYLEDRSVPSVAFAPQQTVAAGNDPHSVAVADFNGDGRLDFVTVNLNDDTASVLLNTTAAGASVPSFAAQTTFAVGNSPQAVAVGDFNGDGRPDLAVVNYNSGTVSVLLNTTAAGATVPTFAAARTFAAGGSPVALAVGDFNGDGRADLAVVNKSAAGTVSVLLNTAAVGASAPSFAAPQSFAVGYLPDAVAVGDFNGDGRADLVVANFTDNNVSVLLDTTATGASTASFAAPRTFAVGGLPSSVAVADFNGDGRPDIVTANEHDNTVSVLLNTTTPGAATASFAGQQTFAAGAFPASVTTADSNGDGRPDLVVADNTTVGTASVLLNTTAAGASTPSFAAAQTFAVGSAPIAVAAADFNGDGRPDFVTANQTGKTASVLLNTTTNFSTTVPVVVADFQGQGVWEYNRVQNIWVQINVSDASLLAADPQGDVVADFPQYGLWEYHPASASWTQLNTSDVSVLAMDAHGDVAADFPHYGVAEYLPASGWRMLGTGDASLLAMDASGDIVGEFPGYGVWENRPTAGWKQLSPNDVTVLAVNALGDVAVNFAGSGVSEYQQATGWRLLNGTQAQSLAIDAAGNITASFHGYGVAEHYAASGSWGGLNPSEVALLALDANGDSFGDFPGYGLWEFDRSRGWYQLRTTDASLLAVA